MLPPSLQGQGPQLPNQKNHGKETAIRRVRQTKFAIISTSVICAFIGLSTLEQKFRSGRRLSENDDCLVSPYADPFGYLLPQNKVSVIFYVSGMCYLFFGLGYVCEEYFVTAIEIIIETYQM